MHGDIVFDKENIIKKVPAGQIEMETAMTMSACQLAESSGIFRVPQVIESNKNVGYIKLEYLSGIKPLHFFLADRTEMKKIIAKSGECLSCIHRYLKPNPASKIPLSGKVAFAGDSESNAYLHGDYNMVNVQYDIVKKQIAVLDWSLTPVTNVTANFGSVYWDIAWHVLGIIYMPPYYFSRSRYRIELVNIFLENYFKQSLYQWNEKLLEHYFINQSSLLENDYLKKIKWYKLRQWYYFISEWKMKNKFKIFPLDFSTGQ